KPDELFASPAGRDAWARLGHFTARFGILAVSGRAAWFGNGGGFIERSSPYEWATADGAHWRQYPVGGPGGVIALPPRRPRVITLGTEFSLDRSADGGKTWTTTYQNTGGAPWSSLSYASRTAGWAEFGSPPDSGLLRTTDAGVTWHQVRFARPARPVTAYFASFSGVTPINTATNKAGKAIKVGAGPFAIAITPDGKAAYVANIDSSTVTPIRTTTNKALKAIKVGSAPGPIAITPDGKTAYVVNIASGTVTPIRTATNRALKAIKVGTGPQAVAITPDGKTAYVVSGASGTVTPIRIATNKAGKAIKVGTNPTVIAITPD